MIKGFVIAAPSSGSGKTVLTLGLLRHLARSGVDVVSAKAGPDYIDPAFHAAATGRDCFNLDPWAMSDATLAGAAGRLAGELVVCEGVMGLFDGAVLDRGSTADLSARMGWPVVLVVDARAQAASAAALALGFATFRDDVSLAGVVFNRVGGEGHRRVLAEAMARTLPDVPVLGFVPRTEGLELPSRHLGLIQAGEHGDLEGFLDRAADLVAANVDIAALRALARPGREGGKGRAPLAPLGSRIAVASDEAFAFRYPLVIDGWRDAGAEISFFSPLADEAPDPDADAVYLPGGYPELHAGRLAANGTFLGGIRAAAGKALVFGECGGYMVLGQGIVDAGGERHAMTGLLPLETSFAERRLHLGYRLARTEVDWPLGRRLRGHEFHYATILAEGPGTPLFRCEDARGNLLGEAGLTEGRVMGSFIHLIDGEDDA